MGGDGAMQSDGPRRALAVTSDAGAPVYSAARAEGENARCAARAMRGTCMRGTCRYTHIILCVCMHMGMRIYVRGGVWAAIPAGPRVSWLVL